jgi:hypothetical protein
MFLSSSYNDFPILFTVILGLSLGCGPTIRLRSPHV